MVKVRDVGAGFDGAGKIKNHFVKMLSNLPSLTFREGRPGRNIAEYTNRAEAGEVHHEGYTASATTYRARGAKTISIHMPKTQASPPAASQATANPRFSRQAAGRVRKSMQNGLGCQIVLAPVATISS